MKAMRTSQLVSRPRVLLLPAFRRNRLLRARLSGCSPTHVSGSWRRERSEQTLHAVAVLVVVSSLLAQALAQTRPSESSGADGALVFTTPGTFAFDPVSRAGGSAGNVFHFTSITIAEGVTLTLSAKTTPGPVFWLSQGPVRIEGRIILDGENGQESATMPNTPGVGGYAGGSRGHAG